MSLWRHVYLAERYGRMRLTLPEIAEQLGLSVQTIRNRKTKGDFKWIAADGRDLFADVADVAEYLEQRRTSRAKTRA
jgi:predicted transcriptional regulator